MCLCNNLTKIFIKIHRYVHDKNSYLQNIIICLIVLRLQIIVVVTDFDVLMNRIAGCKAILDGLCQSTQCAQNLCCEQDQSGKDD
jgi:hypothetical protein